MYVLLNLMFTFVKYMQNLPDIPKTKLVKTIHFSTAIHLILHRNQIIWYKYIILTIDSRLWCNNRYKLKKYKMVLNSNSIKIGIDMWGKYGFVDSHAASAHGKKLIRWTDMSPGRAGKTWLGFSPCIYTYSSSNEKHYQILKLPIPKQGSLFLL